MLIFKLQTHPEPTQTRNHQPQLGYFTATSSPCYRLESLNYWNLPTHRVRITNNEVKKNKSALPDSQPKSTALLSWDFSSISSDSETDPDLLDEQILALPRDGNQISLTEWTLIATRAELNLLTFPSGRPIPCLILLLVLLSRRIIVDSVRSLSRSESLRKADPCSSLRQ
ncbi:hypothetical protein PGT21_005867 [Puccinia graminis f. sp. tritici]|uniref:Uncharacterized protein n=1 Tax=Puccinia graminis f. sp. tritici TaxID=56615 RepID=A0A5B0PFH4_PUCGR|nr:hypothetical protein PGT21_005867 [Puccinia graminis f. sp. tritici]